MRRSLIIGTMLLAGCSGGGGGDGGTVTPPSPTPTPTPTATRAATVAELEASGAIPRLERSSSIAGTDANGDGVRDDVEAYIAARPASDVQKASLRQTARAFRQTVTVDLANTTAVKTTSLAMARGINCVFERFPNDGRTASRYISELEAVSANTRDRLRQYIRYNKALDGTVSAVPQEATCE